MIQRAIFGVFIALAFLLLPYYLASVVSKYLSIDPEWRSFYFVIAYFISYFLAVMFIAFFPGILQRLSNGKLE